MTAHNLIHEGLQHHNASRFAEAEEKYRQALQLDPQNANGLFLIALLREKSGDLPQAIECYRAAVRAKPDFFQALCNLGSALADSGRSNEAADAFRAAIHVQPDVPNLHANLSHALRDQFSLDEAVFEARRSIELDPRYAEGHSALGASLACLGMFETAVAAFEKAISLNPDLADAHLNLGLSLLVQGNFQRGWPEYEWRLRSKSIAKPPNLPQPLWNGEKIRGQTLLIYPEQGFGDFLHLVRYIPKITDLGIKVIVQNMAGMDRLMRDFPGATFISLGQPLPPFDRHCAILSLPGIFKTTLDSIPASIPYLNANPKLTDIWRSRVDLDAFNIGLAWAGNPANKNDRHRSIPLSQLAPLARIPGVRFHSLQKQYPEADAAMLNSQTMKIADWSQRLTDFAETAALIASLDLVICVDTAVAHLAGALGKPVWLMLPKIPDWRWMLDREDSPWYPTMRLFRHSDSGDWPEVVHRIIAALGHLKTDD